MYLIVNADDFGFSKAVNYGIVDAMDDGIVTSTTLMVNMPGTMHAVEIMKKRPTLAVGLHLNIALLKPLSKVNTLIKENGDFFKPKDNPDQSLISEDEIYQEFKMQYEKFVELTNKKPTHFDSHLYTHQVYEKAKRALNRLADEVNIPVREFDVQFEGWFKFNEDKTLQTLKDELINDVHGMLKHQIAELMVHPAYIDYQLMTLSSYNLKRINELEILTSKEVKEFIIKNNIQLTNFNAIKRKKDDVNG